MSELWMDFAACKGMDQDIFYPEGRGNAQVFIREAKKICAGCPARKACLNYAIENNEPFGVWGGLTVQQRAKVRRAPNRQVVCAGCGVPVKPTSSSTRDYCPPCRQKRREEQVA